MNEKEVYKGLKVRFTDQNLHEVLPDYYPEAGTEGTIVSVTKCVHAENTVYILVQWPKGSTSQNDRWFAAVSDLEPV